MVLGSDLRRGNARRGRGPRSAGRGTAALAALVLLLAPAFVACSEDSGGGDESPPPSPTAPATPSEPPASSTPADGPADAAAAEKEVTENWEKFFSPKTSTKDKQAVLENGEQMAPVLAAFSGDERGGQVEAQVTKVDFTSATDATVTYTLLMNGATALPDTKGAAVEQDGTWKVSVNTLCALVQLSGNAQASALPGC